MLTILTFVDSLNNVHGKCSSTHWGRDKVAAILQTTCSNFFFYLRKIYLTSNNLSDKLWFDQRPPSLLIWIFVTRPRFSSLASKRQLTITLTSGKSTGDPLHSRALAHSRAPLFTQPCSHCSHSRAPGEQWARLCVFTLHGCVQAARLCRGSPVKSRIITSLCHVLTIDPTKSSNSITLQCRFVFAADLGHPRGIWLPTRKYVQFSAVRRVASLGGSSELKVASLCRYWVGIHDNDNYNGPS